MKSTRLFRFATLGSILGAFSCPLTSLAAEAPTAVQALGLTPIQKGVDYATPTKEEMAKCTNSPEKLGNITAWVVRNPQGEILRRFADTNGDNVVDQWCYYQNGVEVYRDIDANFNGKADQYRWFHTGGSRWGLDKNEDGKIDAWRTISPHEVGEQVMLALKSRDPARFALLLATSAELNEAGFAKARVDQIAKSIAEAPAGFSKLVTDQKVISPESRFVDFGSARPSAIPAGAAGSTKDVLVIDNASALIETGGKHEQIYLGTLVQIGDTWKLIGAPTLGGNDGQPTTGLLTQTLEAGAGGGNDAGPNDAMQQLMTELEKLDREAANLPEDKQATNIDARAEKLQQLAGLATGNERDQWYRQLADMLSVAAQSGSYPQGLAKLDALQKTLSENGASQAAISHTAFQRMWADYVVNQHAANADPAKIQEKWLADLQVFVAKYPQSDDAAEALLQLGMYQEFVGKMEDATKWYRQLVTDFPNAEPSAKARGALARLTSVGKPVRIVGNDIQGGTVDLSKYRGKPVLVHYWATWCPKEDMVLLKDFYAKKGGRDFDIVGVCLDSNAAGAKQYLAQNRFAWKNIIETGGLDGRLANEMGIMTLPMMILIDKNGNVANNNIHVAELEAELQRLQTPTANNTANSANPPRTTPLPR